MFEGLHGKHIVNVSVGPTHFLAVTKTGVVYGWHCSERGHFRRFSADIVTKLSRSNTPTVASGSCVAVHCGPSQVCWLLTVTYMLLFLLLCDACA